MENKSYYPLRISDKIGGTIVSDASCACDGRSESEIVEEKTYYGGMFICESVLNNQLLHQIVNAYNEKYGDKQHLFSNHSALEMCQWLHGRIGPEQMDVPSHIVHAIVKIIQSVSVDVTSKEEPEFTPEQIQEIMSKQPIHFVEKVDPKPIIKNLIELCDLWGTPDGVKNNTKLNEARKYLGIEYVIKENDMMKSFEGYMDKISDELISELDRDITPGDVINTALEEGSITLDQAFRLNTISHTDDWRNLLIQFQYENKADRLTEKYNKKFLKKDNMMDTIFDELQESKTIFDKFRSKKDNIIDIGYAAFIMIESVKSGSKLLSCGNGGSYSDAQHFASELSGKYRGVRPAIAAIALSDGGAMSCIANDFGFSHVFERQIEAIGRAGDTLLCLSTSGNSDNVVLAVKRAKSIGINVIGIGGNSGGSIKPYCDAFIEIPHAGTADRIQEISIVVIHILVNLIERGIV